MRVDLTAILGTLGALHSPTLGDQMARNARHTARSRKSLVDRFTAASDRKQEVTVHFTSLPGEVRGTAAHVRDLRGTKCLAVRGPGIVTFVPLDSVTEIVP